MPDKFTLAEVLDIVSTCEDIKWFVPDCGPRQPLEEMVCPGAEFSKNGDGHRLLGRITPGISHDCRDRVECIWVTLKLDELLLFEQYYSTSTIAWDSDYELVDNENYDPASVRLIGDFLKQLWQSRKESWLCHLVEIQRRYEEKEREKNTQVRTTLKNILK